MSSCSSCTQAYTAQAYAKQQQAAFTKPPAIDTNLNKNPAQNATSDALNTSGRGQAVNVSA